MIGKKAFYKINCSKLFGTISNKKISILGFSFKSNTNDTREFPAISICRDLLEEGGNLFIYDPKVTMEQISNDLLCKPSEDISELKESGTWQYSKSIKESAIGADAIVILIIGMNFLV